MYKLLYSKICYLLLLSLTLCSASCSADDDQDDYFNPPKRPERYTRQLNVLVLGNSWSRDAFSYAPSVIEDVCPDTYVDMQILYIPGVALNYHINYINDNTPFTVDFYNTYSGRWSSTGLTGEDVLFARNWDMVILQEGSGKGRTYESTLPDVQKLSTYIHSRLPETRIAYMINPGVIYKGHTRDDVWDMYATTARQLLENGDVDYIIPCGTGIQNARRTILDQYGDYGHLSYDGSHLQEGLPCLIEAYVTAQTLFSIYDINRSIEDCKIQTTQKWVDSKRIPGKHGGAIDGLPEDYQLCKRCALLAVEKPFEIQEP